jgi:aminoacyl-tRNA hydrolase
MRFPDGPVKNALKLVRERSWLAAAALKRTVLGGTTFVAVTGSAGKTTTKELLVAILSTHMRGHGTLATANYLLSVAKLVCATKRSHRFCVVELGLSGPGEIDAQLRIVRPLIGVVTSIGSDHVSAFGSREAIAAEKGNLVESLPEDGVAILNADDPLVAAMGQRSRARVLTHGRSAAADLVADAVDATWPERLRFEVHYQGVRVPVRTQFCGEHWVTPVLAAMAAGVALGIPLPAAADAVACATPMRGRMQPHRTREGIDIVRDDWKAPLWTCDAAIDFLRAARAPRKIAVFGTISDLRGDASRQYERLARRALEVADHVVFAGPWASRVLGVVPPSAGKTIRGYGSVQQASEYVRSIARPGDLVLLKGTNKRDHLERIVFAFDDEVRCWRDDCGRESFCIGCRYLHVPSVPDRDTGAAALAPSRARGSPHAPGGDGALPSPAVAVGLGNPGARFRDTPHNVGHAVLDALAGSRRLHWEQVGDAWIAHTGAPDAGLYLVKLGAHVNDSGAALRALLEERCWNPARCTIVHDDLDLPLGRVKVRMRGSAGGHKGVASILDALQTDAIPRVKVGIGRPGRGTGAEDFVLRPFSGDDLPLVRAALTVALERLLRLAAGRTHGTTEDTASAAGDR